MLAEVASNEMGDRELLGEGDTVTEIDRAKEFFEPSRTTEQDDLINEDPVDDEHHMLLSPNSSTIKAFPSSPDSHPKPL